MADFDTLDSLKKDGDAPDDLFPLMGKSVGYVRFKFFTFLFFLFLLISSDIFVLKMLSHINQATTLGIPTSYGKLIQGGLLVAGGLAIDLLITWDVV